MSLLTTACFRLQFFYFPSNFHITPPYKTESYSLFRAPVWWTYFYEVETFGLEQTRFDGAALLTVFRLFLEGQLYVI